MSESHETNRSSSNAAKYCGNCRFHNLYKYPEEILCISRFAKRLDHIVSTLWHCEDWEISVQECFCVKEAIKAKKEEECGRNY